jgi:thioredoxin reductase (NADPH)
LERYDIAVIGSGPAGLEAALNLAIRKKRFLLFGAKALSRKLTAAPVIDNYLGLPGISGEELAKRYREHLEKMNVAITEEQVTTVYPMEDYFALATAKNTFEATAVILAAGAAPQSLLPGEERLLGRGVGYCATCDAPLYRGKRVAVLGWNEEAVQEAAFVSELAQTVWFFPMRPLEKPLRDGIIRVDSQALEIMGEKTVSGLRTKDGVIELDGVFVLREVIAPSSLVPGLRAENGFVAVNSDMLTNIPGLYAAGDCTGKPHQLMRAAGQGQTAALKATAWIDSLKRE